MNKCLRITFSVDLKAGFLHDVVQAEARKNALEGYAQQVNTEQVRIIVCGDSDKIEAFLDALHRQSLQYHIANIVAEPFLKDRDYRSVFRVIE